MLTSFFNIFLKYEKFIILAFLFVLPLSEALKNILLIVLFIIFIFKLSKKQLIIKFDIVDIFVGLHLFVAFLGVFFGVNSHETLKHLPDLIYIFFLYFYFRYSIDLKRIDIGIIFNIIFISFILTGIYGIIDFFYFHHNIYLTLKSVGSVNRTTVYAVFVFIIALGYYLYSNNKLALITVLFGTLFIFLTGSRMGMFPYPVIVIFMLYLFNKINTRNTLFILSFTISVFLIIVYLFPHSHIAKKIHEGLHDPARIQIWVSCIYIWLAHNIFFGIGMGNSIYFSTKTYFGKKAIEGYINNAHNTYLDMLLERGLLGLITYLGIIFSLFYKFWNTRENYLSKIGMTLIFSSLIMSFMNITFRYEFAMLFMSMMGLFLNSLDNNYKYEK